MADDVYDALPGVLDAVGLAARMSDGRVWEGAVPPATDLPNAYYEPVADTVTGRTNRSRYGLPLVSLVIQDKTFTKAKAHVKVVRDALKEDRPIPLAAGTVEYCRTGSVSYVPEAGFVKAALEIEFLTAAPK